MQAAEFDEFYAASFAPITRQLYAVIGDYAEAQDCVQEAFVRAWHQRRKLARDGSPTRWVRTTAYRLAVSRWRSVTKDRRAHVRAAAQPPPTPPDEAVDRLVEALGTLPIEMRRALVLHHLCDLSVADVARELDAPEGTIKARLSRGREALRDAMELTNGKEADHV